MAEEPAAEPLDSEEEEGGPIKSFLEHLEDLRWVLIKSIAAAGVAMIACFFAGNHVFNVLYLPLLHAPMDKSAKTQSVRVMLGTNQLGVFHSGTNDALTVLAGTNRFVRLDLVPVTIGTNRLLGVNVDLNDAPSSHQTRPDIVTLGPVAAFVVATKIAFYGGLAISSPFLFYFVAQFVFPALKMREKKYVYRGLFFGVGLFLTGVLFCYFIMLPMALAVSAQYAEWFGFKAAQWRAEEYISFVCKFMFGMGIGFEMPVVILTLVKIGLLSYRVLKSARPYVIIIAFVLGAVLTTPEVITQVLMAIPLLVLYEISVWIAWYWEWRDKKREEAAAAAEATSGDLPNG
jgi:sec-independent protein translocase protein TatC